MGGGSILTHIPPECLNVTVSSQRHIRTQGRHRDNDVDHKGRPYLLFIRLDNHDLRNTTTTRNNTRGVSCCGVGWGGLCYVCMCVCVCVGVVCVCLVFGSICMSVNNRVWMPQSACVSWVWLNLCCCMCATTSNSNNATQTSNTTNTTQINTGWRGETTRDQKKFF